MIQNGRTEKVQAEPGEFRRIHRQEIIGISEMCIHATVVPAK
jgi:hypothetical protein